MERIDKEALELCERYITAELGIISDLPYELANTVANIYYHFFRLALPFLPKEDTLSTGSLRELREELFSNSAKVPVGTKHGQSFPVRELASALASVESVPKFINILRTVNKDDDPYQYRQVMELILDILKYNIEGAENKLVLQRMAERIKKKFKKEVNEITGLIDMLSL